ncbi:hypothetical protein SEUCBS140593_010794 [Sporothrix eucalyptigena]|uniref:non-reducing end alpha-L-arabinofuranosidase n=1 Tax=Sporothrix eucalyptigena TaxID=1812306 RepID=A0ABP0D2A5_9PEZI
MTTFTQIPDGEAPSIDVSLKRIVSDINPMMYGGFLEHMGRCIYGGVYDPDNKHSAIDENGFRTDVIDAFKELQIPVIRYPGGNFVATYHWEDGVGPRGQRPRRWDPAWKAEESNEFGTDEFMKFCEVVGTEPYLALNMGTGTLDEALNWLEYCNSDRNTYYANLRRKNGREKPYNVKYWALGNETWGPWQVEEDTKENYAKRAKQWAKALKLADPRIELILCGKNGHDDWDRYVLQECVDLVDMHSIHLYTYSHDFKENVTAPLSAERAIQITASLSELALINNPTGGWRSNDYSPPASPPKICFDEWNVYDDQQAPGDQGGEQAYNLSDALGVAVWLNVFIRQSKHIAMANIAQSVNVLGPLSTRKDGGPGLIRQTLWWPLLLFSKYMRGKTLNVHLRASTYNGSTFPSWIRKTTPTPWLDVSCAYDEVSGFVNLAVVNIDDTQDITVDLGLQETLPAGLTTDKQQEVQVFTVGGGEIDVKTTNFDGVERVGVVESTWIAGPKYTFPKHSLTLLRWSVKA